MARTAKKFKSLKRVVPKRFRKKIGKAISKRVKKHYGFLKKLASLKSLQAIKRMLKRASSGEILAIAEIVLNILRRNIPLTVKQKKLLCPVRNLLRQVASKKTNCDTKRHICTHQRGGILGIIGTILSAAIPAITGLITSFTQPKQQ